MVVRFSGSSHHHLDPDASPFTAFPTRRAIAVSAKVSSCVRRDFGHTGSHETPFAWEATPGPFCKGHSEEESAAET